MMGAGSKWLGVAVLLFCCSGATLLAEPPTWAKRATAFPAECNIDMMWHSQLCQPLRIPAPDGKSAVEVTYRKGVGIDSDDTTLRARLQVSLPNGSRQTLTPPEGFHSMEVLWSPDSKASFLDGGNGGGYWGFWTVAYFLDGDTVEQVDVTSAVRKDMLETFPPCRALGADPVGCQEFSLAADYPNMSAIAWSTEPAGVVILAQVPCSGTYGGIQCQARGYVVSVPGGKIVETMSARELKERWQPRMAFTMRVPGPPKYEAAATQMQ